MSLIWSKKTGKLDNTVHEISDDGDVVQKEVPQQPNLISILKQIAPLTINKETIVLPIEKENESLPNLYKEVEIESQPIVAEITPKKSPSPIENPKEAFPP